MFKNFILRSSLKKTGTNVMSRFNNINQLRIYEEKRLAMKL